jgi:hypothetical protein
MPKGDIVGMFIGRVCFSLMERTIVMMAGLQPECTWQEQQPVAKTQKNKVEKLRRNNIELHAECKRAQGRGEFHYQISGEIAFPEMQTRSHTSRLTEGSKVVAFDT